MEAWKCERRETLILWQRRRNFIQIIKIVEYLDVIIRAGLNSNQEMLFFILKRKGNGKIGRAFRKFMMFPP